MERSRKLIVLIILGLGLFLVVWLGFSIYQNSHFRLTGTMPSLNAVPAELPEIVFNYNWLLGDQGLAVSSSPAIIESKSVSDKKLIVKLLPLTANQDYSITIVNIQSKNGQKITNHTYHFKSKNIALKNLPVEVQKKILDAQKDKGIFGFNFANIKSLTDHGLPSLNMTALQGFIYNYAQSLKPPLTSAVVDSSSVTRPPRDPANPPTSFSMSFNIAFGANLYKAQLTYTNDSDTHLTLNDLKTGALLYDSVSQGTQ